MDSAQYSGDRLHVRIDTREECAVSEECGSCSGRDEISDFFDFSGYYYIAGHGRTINEGQAGASVSRGASAPGN